MYEAKINAASPGGAADTDATQEAFVHVLARRELVSVLCRTELRKYIIACAFNAARDEARRLGRAKGRARRLGLAHAVSEPAVSDKQIEAQFEVWRVIDALPAEWAKVIVYCDLLGFSARETASMLGVPQGTVSTWLRRARENFLFETRLPRREEVSKSAEVEVCGLPILSQTTAHLTLPGQMFVLFLNNGPNKYTGGWNMFSGTANLPPGSYYTNTRTLTVPSVPAGIYWVLWQIDTGNTTSEYDESDNAVHSAMTVRVLDC